MKSNSKATAKWDEKNGIIAKTYKLKKSTVEEFAEACEEHEKSPAEVLTELMSAYINSRAPKETGFVFFRRSE